MKSTVRQKVFKLKKKQKKQLAVLTLIILIASLVAVILLSPVFNVRNFKVIDNKVVTEEEIVAASGVGKNVNILSVDVDTAEKNIESLPYIKSAEIERSFPDTLKIRIVEEIGVAYFVAKEGYVIISPEGKCIEVTDGVSGGNGVAEAPSLPVIRGIEGVKYSKGEIIKAKDSVKIKELTKCLREFLRQGYVFDMKEIDVSDIEDIRFYYKGKDLCVSVGDTHNIDYKMDCFMPFYKFVLNEKTPAGQLPKGFIDLEHSTYRENMETAVERRAKTQQKEEAEEKNQ